MDKLTEKQEKKIKKKALEEKIRTYRLLFNLGVEEAVEQNVNDWILYHKQKEKARNVDDAKKNAEEKIKLLESLGLNNRSKKIRKVLYGRKKELADEKIDSLVISAKDEINSRMNYRPNSMENYEDDCLELFNVLIKYEIYSGCGESRHTMYNTCQNPRLSKPFVKIYGFGKEHPTDAVEELSKRFEILRNAYVLDYDIGFDVNTKRNRKNYYDARQNLRKIIRGKKKKMNFIEEKDFVYVMNAHTNFARKESKKYRKFDGKTPYYFHPFWCATTIASETNLDERIREKGTKVLLYHDLPEDTKLDLPKWLSFEEIYDIEDMTFENGFKQESEEIWEKADRIKLYKLYDKTSNLLDAAWMSDEKKELYLKYTSKLCEEAEKNYGELNITKMFKGVF